MKKTQSEMPYGPKVAIFDTTLRDGQQCPGAGMSLPQNLEYAALAAALKVDILEAGFPAASKLDFRIVHDISELYAALEFSPVVAALCQLREEQVITTIEALAPITKRARSRLHIYLPVDPNLMLSSLGARATDKAQLVSDVAQLVLLGHRAGLEVEFSPEGYSTMGENFDFVTDLIRAAVQSGATVINCPDTMGAGFSYQREQYFVAQMSRHAQLIGKEFPACNIIWSAHCHNDFGLALENSLNAVFQGPARQIEGCINGIGERAGNVALEQAIMAIKHFAHLVDPDRPVYTDINLAHLKGISDFVKSNMLARQPHWPITGDNAARHSSGGHTNAILKNPLAYQPFDPAEVGSSISLLFGPLSGGNHAKAIIEKAGFICGDHEKSQISQFVKERFAERRKGITDEELLSGYFEFRQAIVVENIEYSKESGTSSVTIKGRFFDQEGQFTEKHDGKDSAIAALKKAIDHHMPGLHVESHRSESAGEGIDAVSISNIVLFDDAGQTYLGQGGDQDIEVAAMKALIDATNRAFISHNFRLENARNRFGQKENSETEKS